MSIRKNIKRLVLATALLVPGLVHAAVALPGFDIQDLSGDTGATVTSTSFAIDATAFAIIFDDSNLDIDIADEIATFTSDSGSYDSLADSGFGYGSFGGTFSIGSLLSGNFSNLEVFGYGNDIDYEFESDLTFTSGSLMGSFTGGRIEGAISGDIVIAKLGEIAVVPVPAAAWLFASGLIGLIGVARRKDNV